MFRHFLLKFMVIQKGREPLPRCNMCIMHMPEGRLLKHRRTAFCFRNNEMRIRRREVEVATRCLEMELSLTSEEGEDTIEGVALLKYLGWPMEKSDNAWPAVRTNIRKALQIWGRLGVILRREGGGTLSILRHFTEQWYRRCSCLGRICGSCQRPWRSRYRGSTLFFCNR